MNKDYASYFAIAFAVAQSVSNAIEIARITGSKRPLLRGLRDVSVTSAIVLGLTAAAMHSI